MRRLALLALLLVPGEASAGGARILLSGVALPEVLRFEETRSFTEYAETGSLQASYRKRAGFGGELGLEYDFTPHLGLRGSLSYVRRTGSASYAARLPHPLYLDRHRLASGEAGGLDQREAMGNLDLVLILGDGAFRVSLLGGVAFFRVDATLLADVQKRESYPYDDVEITGVTSRRLTDTPIGYAGGLGLDWRLGRRFGLGLQARYARARVRLGVSEGDTVVFDAGGLQAAFGVRLWF